MKVKKMIVALVASTALLAGCGGGTEVQTAAPAAVTQEAVVATEEPTEAAPEPVEVTEEPTEEVTSEVTEEEPVAAGGVMERAEAIRTEFRDANTGRLSTDPALSCDDTIEDLGGGVVAGCGTDAGLALFFVPQDTADIQPLTVELMNESMMMTCVGDDYVAATPSVPVAEYFAETMDCEFP